jgi:hypothetical protein
MDFEIIKNWFSFLQTKVRNIVKRGYVTKPGDDTSDYHIIQISYLSPAKTANAELISPYGLSVNLPKDIQVLTFSVQAHEENKACIGYSQSGRFKNLEPGEVVVGNPGTGSFVKFVNDGTIEVSSTDAVSITTTADVNITADNVVVDANKVDLGTGGAKIARLGDAVQVNLGTGIGTITSGGTNTSI